MKKILLTLIIVIFCDQLMFAQATSLVVQDTRSDTTSPSSYSKSLLASFKTASVLGLPVSGTIYYTIIGLRGWISDNTGGKAHELAFSDDSRLFYRSGNTPSWEQWRQIPVTDVNGNLGIGITSPLAKLDISDGNGTGVIAYIGASNVSGANGIYLDRNGSASNPVNIQGTKVGIGPQNISLQAGGGNVSIGTTDPKGYKLAVNGSAIATSMTVKLNANWPDYVFKKDYQLPSLTEVKAYIDKNQHLPDMPSAQEIENNGQNLGEMNKLLTKKVEELTLYLIELNKQLKEQQKEIEKLKK